MLGAILSALGLQVSRTPGFGYDVAEVDAYRAVARAQVAAMSADERRQLAAAGRAYDIRQRPTTFPSLDAQIAYHHQRLLEMIAMNESNSTEAQQDTHEKQWDAATAVQQAPTHQPVSAANKIQPPHTPEAARSTAEAEAASNIPAVWAPPCAPQAKLSVTQQADSSAAAIQPCGEQVPEDASKAGQQARRRAAMVAAEDASRVQASAAYGRGQQHRQQQHLIAAPARARHFHTVSAQKKTQ